MRYVPLNVKSHYTMLGALPSPGELVERAAQLGLCALALNDVETMAGVPEFVHACRRHSIKPLIGTEDSSHRIWIAKDHRGYLALCAGELRPSPHLIVIGNHHSAGSLENVQHVEGVDVPEHVVLQVASSDARRLRLVQCIGSGESYDDSLVTEPLDARCSLEVFPEASQPMKQRTLDIAAQVTEYDIFSSPRLPPSFGSIEDACRQRCPDEPAYTTRLEHELAVIRKMGFEGYFAIVADFVGWAKANQIPVGPGRGSVAGSLVAWLLRITECDPIEHDLLFERFLNPDRVSMPDIDVDICMAQRERVLSYIKQKYGHDQVAHIVTHSCLRGKAAINDVSRAMGMSWNESQQVSNLMPPAKRGKTPLIKEALATWPAMRTAAASNTSVARVLRAAASIEGKPRHKGQHAAGIVISDRHVNRVVPTEEIDGELTTQYTMEHVEECGLVKFDLLGLRTLTIVDDCQRSLDMNINWNAVGLQDPHAYELLQSGQTNHVFQLESRGMQRLCKQVKPSKFQDIALLISLYRPGPIDNGMLEQFVARRTGKERVLYEHEFLRRVCLDTLGVVVYQEQVMQIAQEMAGFSAAEADSMRRAMGKKKPQEMAKCRGQFVSGAVSRGHSEPVAAGMWNKLAKFAEYGFNRSHAVAYAMLSYRTAYLKARHPVAFMCAVLNNQSTPVTLERALADAKQMRVPMLPAHLNHSDMRFTLVRVCSAHAIRGGLASIKGVGEKRVRALLSARQTGGPFRSVSDLLSRVDRRSVNAACLQALSDAGVLKGLT